MTYALNHQLVLPGHQIPSFRNMVALQNRVEKNILVKVWGGIGDQACSEPCLRWALDTFKGVRISIATKLPELFGHLPFARVYDLEVEQPVWSDYYVFETIHEPQTLMWEFMSHMLVNCVDYPSLCAFRCQMPLDRKPLRLRPSDSDVVQAAKKLDGLSAKDFVVVHAGKHWASKTFPEQWWNAVLRELQDRGFIPVLIGADADDNRGTVDVDTRGCFDLRNQLSLMQSVAVLQAAKVVLTNDSSPLHLAASGDAWIGFFATVKHPDYIKHWRGPDGAFGWRMENLERGGLWSGMDNLPNRSETISLEACSKELMCSFLPEPSAVADWAMEKMR